MCLLTGRVRPVRVHDWPVGLGLRAGRMHCSGTCPWGHSPNVVMKTPSPLLKFPICR